MQQVQDMLTINKLLQSWQRQPTSLPRVDHSVVFASWHHTYPMEYMVSWAHAFFRTASRSVLLFCRQTVVTNTQTDRHRDHATSRRV